MSPAAGVSVVAAASLPEFWAPFRDWLGLRHGVSDALQLFALGFARWAPVTSLTPFLGVGYTFFGDPSGLQLDDAVNYTVGATYRLDARDSVGGSLDGRERVSPGSAEQRELVEMMVNDMLGLGLGQACALDLGTGPCELRRIEGRLGITRPLERVDPLQAEDLRVCVHRVRERVDQHCGRDPRLHRD